MARDTTPYIRQAVVGRLKAAAAAAGGKPVPAQSIFPQRPPANAPWPRLQYGRPISAPFRAGCLDGTTTTFAVHAFAETTGEGAATIDGERAAGDLAAWAAGVLGSDGEHGLTIDLRAESDCPYPATLFLDWTGTQVFADGAIDADAFHGIATFSATVTS